MTSSTTSCCFTKSYGSYLKGTGSLIIMENISGDAKLFLNGSSNTIEEMENNKNGKKIVSTQRPTKRSKIENEAKTEEVVVREEREEEEEEEEEEEVTWYEKFGTNRLRYFTPNEILKLLGFPSGYVFHESISLKKSYALLGNSLHVGTVARLLHVLFLNEEAYLSLP